MTDEQIIFKCDVDCIRKNTEECFELDCIKGQESILKQLKRKEQECDQLKAENDELKEEQNKKRDHYFIISNENARLEDEKARLGYKLNSEIQKLKQTLTEIKEICSIGIVHGLSADEYAESLNILKFEILQKIGEVEDE